MIGTTTAGSSETKTHEFKRPATIVGAVVGTEVGQEFALRNYAHLIRDGGRTNLWQSLDKEFLAGNGRDYDFQLRLEVTKGDKLILKTENDSQNGWNYHHSMLIRVDYETSLAGRLSDAIGRFL